MNLKVIGVALAAAVTVMACGGDTEPEEAVVPESLSEAELTKALVLELDTIPNSVGDRVVNLAERDPARFAEIQDMACFNVQAAADGSAVSSRSAGRTFLANVGEVNDQFFLSDRDVAGSLIGLIVLADESCDVE